MHRTTHLSTALLLGSLCFLVGNIPACGESSEEAPVDPRYQDVAFRNGTTDEALGSLLATTPIIDPARAPVLVYPTRGAHVPVAPPLVIRWKALPGLATRESAPLPFRTAHARRGWSPISTAYAHGPSFSGPAYFLVIQTPSDPTFRRVFTTETSYQVDEKTWEALVGTRAAFIVSVTAGYIDANRLRPDTPPARSDVLPFDIGISE